MSLPRFPQSPTLARRSCRSAGTAFGPNPSACILALHAASTAPKFARLVSWFDVVAGVNCSRRARISSTPASRKCLVLRYTAAAIRLTLRVPCRLASDHRSSSWSEACLDAAASVRL
eukprot:scaffold139957_cov93-Phaeocystis_antarctica.AAC.1